jgi:hypothetical protein
VQISLAQWADAVTRMPCHAIMARLHSTPGIAPPAWLQEMEALVNMHCPAPPTWSPPAAALSTLLPADVAQDLEVNASSALSAASTGAPALLAPLQRHLQHGETPFWRSPERVRQSCAQLWDDSAQLCAYIEVVVLSAAAPHDAAACTEPVCQVALALVLVAGLSHPNAHVVAAIGRCMLSLSTSWLVALLPTLAWRLAQPIATGVCPLKPPLIISATKASEEHPGADNVQVGSDSEASNAISAAARALPDVKQLQELLRELPAPSEMLCVPHALLQLHATCWQHPDVVGAALKALGMVLRYQKCALHRACVHASRPEDKAGAPSF